MRKRRITRFIACFCGLDKLAGLAHQGRHSSVRFRIDATLREVVQTNRALHAALMSRLKIMPELAIAEKRLPQDGRISLRWSSRAVDMGVGEAQ